VRTTERERQFSGGRHCDISFLWDRDDRLRLVNESGVKRFSALYDGDGVRVHKEDTRSGVLQANDYSYGPTGLLWSSNPNTVYTPGFGHRSNGINTFYHHDWLGSTRYTSDSTGTTFPQMLRFDAFGNRSATGGTAPYTSTDLQFAGSWNYQTEWSNGASDPGLGLQYLQQRYYDPAIGRFVSPDPIGFLGGLNPYRYCGNDPVNCVDPSGQFFWVILDAIAFGQDLQKLYNDLGDCSHTPGAIATDVGWIALDVLSAATGLPPAAHYIREALALSHAGVEVYAAGRVGLSGLNLGRAYFAGKKGQQTKPSPPPSTPPTLPEGNVYQKGEVRFEHYYGSIENDHGPAHVHVKGGGDDTRIRYGGGPVNDTDSAMTRVQRRAFEEGKDEIQPRINKIGRWLDWMSKYGPKAKE
jgi:RHS repeat-associated protein